MIDLPLAQALGLLASALDRLGIRFMVVGSLASSAYGAYRATADGDLLARLAPGKGKLLAAALGAEWYADEDDMERAIRDLRSFNVIHIPTAQKFDIFPIGTAYQAVELERAAPIAFPSGEITSLPFASMEDTVLSKLQWYREGGSISERQWSDVTRLIALHPELDWEYLRTWAPRLNIADLLARAQQEANR